MMEGEDVRQVQRVVDTDVDGLFGPLTEIAVKDFQAKMGLATDGVVGSKTWKAIQDYTGESPVVVDEQSQKRSTGSFIDNIWIAGGAITLIGIAAAISHRYKK